MDAQKLLASLEEFYTKTKAELLKATAETLSDDDLEIVLDELRKRELWGDKNDTTLDSIASGGKSRGQAFAMLANGNNAIRVVLSDVLGVGAKPKKK